MKPSTAKKNKAYLITEDYKDCKTWVNIIGQGAAAKAVEEIIKEYALTKGFILSTEKKNEIGNLDPKIFLDSIIENFNLLESLL